VKFFRRVPSCLGHDHARRLGAGLGSCCLSSTLASTDHGDLFGGLEITRTTKSAGRGTSVHFGRNGAETTSTADGKAENLAKLRQEAATGAHSASGSSPHLFSPILGGQRAIFRFWNKLGFRIWQRRLESPSAFADVRRRRQVRLPTPSAAPTARAYMILLPQSPR